MPRRPDAPTRAGPNAVGPANPVDLWGRLSNPDQRAETLARQGLQASERLRTTSHEPLNPASEPPRDAATEERGRLSNPRVDTRVQRRLTAGDVDALVAAYGDGATVDGPAKRFNVHRTTVMDHLHRHGIRGRSLRKLTDREVANAAHQYRRGTTLDQLAEQFSVAPSTLRKALTAAGVPIRRRGRRRVKG